MKPIIVIPPNTISDRDITLLRENGLCVVKAKDPSKVKFIDPIPCQSSRTEMEDAAIKLSRRLLAGDLVGADYRKNVAALYVDILVKGTALDIKGSREEQEQQLFDSAKREEIARLAREEAKAERVTQKTKQLTQSA